MRVNFKELAIKILGASGTTELPLKKGLVPEVEGILSEVAHHRNAGAVPKVEAVNATALIRFGVLVRTENRGLALHQKWHGDVLGVKKEGGRERVAVAQ